MDPDGWILLIEENDFDARRFREVLATEGIEFPVRVFSCPSDAKASFIGAPEKKGNPALPLAIVVSLGLEPRVGFDFVRWLRGQPEMNEAIVIAVGQSGRMREVQESYAAGVNAY